MSSRPIEIFRVPVTGNNYAMVASGQGRGARVSDQPDGAESKTAKPAVENSGWRVVDFSKLKNPPAAFAAGVYLIVTIIGGASPTLRCR